MFLENVLKDRFGTEIKVGDTIIVAQKAGRDSRALSKRVVSRLTKQFVCYLDDSTSWRGTAERKTYPSFVAVQYANTPTVVVVLATDDQGQLITIRRNNEPGKGLLGLPGGYQMAGETWQEAGVREFLEETGLWVDPESLKLVSMDTDEYGNNLIIAVSHLPVTKSNTVVSDPVEVQEVVRVLDTPASSSMAFPRHYKAIELFFQTRGFKL